METHHFPSDLAECVTSLWDTFIGGAVDVEEAYVRPLLPSPSQLKSLLETAYLASLETHEAHALEFFICCTPDLADAKDHYDFGIVEAWEFRNHRPYDVDEIRRLGLATNLDTSALWVSFPHDPQKKLSIWGLVNFGGRWAEARRGHTYSFDSLPHALSIRAEGPGRLIVYQGDYAIVSLAGGKIIEGQSVPTVELLGINSLFDKTLENLKDKITSPEHESPKEWNSFQWIALINAIYAILNEIQRNGYGGTLIFVREMSIVEDLLRIKYRLSRNIHHLRYRFIELINSRHKHSDYLWQNPSTGKAEDSTSTLELQEAQRKLAETCSFIGRLAATDGAIVLDTNLDVIGFGVEILTDKLQSAQVWEIPDYLKPERIEGDSEQFGMRHRSAMRLCAAIADCASFVVSQDGEVSLMWKEEGRGCFTKGIKTTNANMILA